MTHAIEDTGGRFLGAMLVARNIGYLSQVHSTLNYSRKLAALGRLMAGVAHEVKNPLNAMTIHLELLKQKLARQPVAAAGRRMPDRRIPDPGFASAPDVTKHVDIIAQGDSAPRRRVERLPQVRAARRAEAAAGPPRDAHLRHSDLGDAGGRAGGTLTMKVDCPETLPGDQRGSRHAVAGAAEPCAERVPGDARRRDPATQLPRRRPDAASRSTSKIPASASRPSISDGFSISISRPRNRAAASVCRWSTASSSCMTGKSKCSRRRAAARVSG